MALTRSQAEVIIVSRCGGWMAAANMDVVADGSNDDLTDPLAQALTLCDLPPADGITPDDASLALLPMTRYSKFLDLAELRTLESILNNLVVGRVAAGPLSEDLTSLMVTVRDRITAKQKYIQTTHSIGAGKLRSGIINLNFQEPESEE